MYVYMRKSQGPFHGMRFSDSVKLTQSTLQRFRKTNEPRSSPQAPSKWPRFDLLNKKCIDFSIDRFDS